MHHAAARLVVDRILSGEGFGEQAVAMVQAALLHDRADCPAELRPRFLAAAVAAPVDPATPYAHPLNQLAVPVDADGLCRQLAPALLAHPADPGMGVASLWALATLWPHVGAEERPLMRTRLLNGLASRRCPDSALLTSFQLREWQKQVPTSFGNQPPSVASLRGILEVDDPLAAYLLLAEHLGMAPELETLCWVLGSLAAQLVQTSHDRNGGIAMTLQGLVACERLVPHVPVEYLAVVISQLAHRLWWLRSRAGLQAIRLSLDHSVRPYTPALLSGDITLAQRAARGIAEQRTARFWEESWRAIDEQLPGPNRYLPRLLGLCDAAAWRAGDGVVSGEDAGAIAGAIAGGIYRTRSH